MILVSNCLKIIEKTTYGINENIMQNINFELFLFIVSLQTFFIYKKGFSIQL